MLSAGYTRTFCDNGGVNRARICAQYNAANTDRYQATTAPGRRSRVWSTKRSELQQSWSVVIVDVISVVTVLCRSEAFMSLTVACSMRCD